MKYLIILLVLTGFAFSQTADYTTWKAFQGHTTNKFGRNPDVDTGGFEDIWDGGGAWSQPSAAQQHNIASSDAADSVSSTGALTVTLYGLDANWAEASETITMAGTDSVLTTNSYLIVYRMKVITAGSGGANAGTISATGNTDKTVTAQITIGANQTLMAIWAVPAGTVAYITQYYASMNRSVTTGASNVRLLVKPFGSVWQVKHIIGVVGAGASHFSHPFLAPMKVEQKSLVKLQADASANNTDVSAGFDLYTKIGSF